MRRYFLLVVCLCLASLLRAQNKLELISPNGELKVSLNLSDKIYYSIDYNGDVLLKDNRAVHQFCIKQIPVYNTVFL